MAKRPLPSPELLRQLLRYEPETGKLFWRERTPEMMKQPYQCAAWNRKYADKEAFTTIGTHGYRCGSIGENKAILAHRVIVAMKTGRWPTAVDHDNRIRIDNRWRNLKPSTHAGNHRNYSLRADNKSGVTGVFFSRSHRKWLARIHDRSGRCQQLGMFDEMEPAVAARRAAEIKYGYHPSHGRAAYSAPASA